MTLPARALGAQHKRRIEFDLVFARDHQQVAEVHAGSVDGDTHFARARSARGPVHQL